MNGGGFIPVEGMERLVVFAVVILGDVDMDSMGSSFFEGVMEVTISSSCSGVSLMVSKSWIAAISASNAAEALDANVRRFATTSSPVLPSGSVDCRDRTLTEEGEMTLVTSGLGIWGSEGCRAGRNELLVGVGEDD